MRHCRWSQSLLLLRFASATSMHSRHDLSFFRVSFRCHYLSAQEP